MAQENILRVFQDTAERRGDAPCFLYKKDKIWHALNWVQTLNSVKQFSESIKKLQIVSGDRVAILSTTRYEWTIIDVAILSLGGVTVPIYQSTLADEAQYILENSETRLIFVENSTQLEKILKVRAQLPKLEKIVMIEGESAEAGVMSFEEFKALGEGIVSDFESRIREINLEQLASIVYTSGTTGHPKGVMISHGNIFYVVKSTSETFPLEEDYVGLFFLPLAHILARAIQFLQLGKGFPHAYAESIDKLSDNIQEVRPHFMVSVPRIFEKIYSKMMYDVENSSSTKKSIFEWARKIGVEYSAYLLKKETPPLTLRLSYGLAYRLVFSKLNNKLGGRIRFFISGGAPLSKDIAEFFYSAGILILEGYGLTETMAASNVNMPDHFTFGTVGKHLPYIEEKIAEDGEILIRGKMVSQGYWKNPEATKEAFNSGGWFHTGDIGEFDQNGHLKITDRKKDIIVTAGGKNIAPQNIENMLKTNPLFSQVVVHGDRRKYLSALVTLNLEELKKKAKKLEIDYKTDHELLQHPLIYNMAKQAIDEKNRDLPKYETIKKFAILDKDFSIESGELTPTLKVKRKVINERYKDILDKLYSEAEAY